MIMPAPTILLPISARNRSRSTWRALFAHRPRAFGPPGPSGVTAMAVWQRQAAGLRFSPYQLVRRERLMPCAKTRSASSLMPSTGQRNLDHEIFTKQNFLAFQRSLDDDGLP